MARRTIIAENMYRQLHADSPPPARAPAQHKGPAFAPRLLICYLCGQQFGSASLTIHQSQCYVKKLLIWERGAVETRGKRPIPPEEHEALYGGVGGGGGGGGCGGGGIAKRDIAQYNDQMFESFQQNALVPCPTCGRTFLPDRLQIHLRSCKPGNSAKRVEAAAPTAYASAAAASSSPPQRPGVRPSTAGGASSSSPDQQQLLRRPGGSRPLAPSGRFSEVVMGRGHDDDDDTGLTGCDGGGDYEAPSLLSRDRPSSGRGGSPLLRRHAPVDTASPSAAATSTTAPSSDQQQQPLDYAETMQQVHALLHRTGDPALDPAVLPTAQSRLSLARAERKAALGGDPTKSESERIAASLYPSFDISRPGSAGPSSSSPPARESKFPGLASPSSHYQIDQGDSGSGVGEAEYSGSPPPQNNVRNNNSARPLSAGASRSPAATTRQSASPRATSPRLTLAERAAANFGRCRHCNRTFAPDRISRHEDVCIERNKAPAPPRSLAAGAARATTPKQGGAPAVAVGMARRPKSPVSTLGGGGGGGGGGGAPVPTLRAPTLVSFCVECGGKLTPTARFCSSCGSKVA